MTRRVVLSRLPGAALVAVLAVGSAQPADGKPAKSNLTVKSVKSTTSGTVAHGATVTATAVVRNAGPAKASATKTWLVLTAGKKPKKSDPKIAVVSTPALKRKASSKALVLAGPVPTAVKPGKYGLYVCADGEGKVKESSEADNCKAGPQLSVVAPTSQPNPPAGNTPEPPERPAPGQTPAPGPGLGPAPGPGADPTPTPQPGVPDPVEISIADTAVTEGNSGVTDLVFTVSLSAPSATEISVGFRTEDVTAQSGVDYVAREARLVFPAGSISQPLAVTVNADTLDEPNERLAIELEGPSGAKLGRARAVGTITDDDVAAPGPVTISAADAVLKEGDDGERSAEVTLTTSRALPGAASVRVRSVAGGSATAGVDYAALDRTVALAAGATGAVVAVPVLGDSAPEDDETVRIDVSAATGVQTDDDGAVVTILDDDATPDAPPIAPNTAALTPPAAPEEVLGDTSEQTVPSKFSDGIDFLYEGTTPIQSDVQPDAISPVQASVVRGRVLTTSGAPVPGARVSVAGRPQLGFTASRDDGGFDLAANGGGEIVVEIERAGYLTVQRTVEDAPWQDYTDLGDIVLRPFTRKVDEVALDASQAQVAEGPPVSDAAGERRSTLLFLPGTEASATKSDGSSVELSSLGVRSTEYTAGQAGADAMPGDLPPTSGFTYAVELSADEAVRVGAGQVDFSKPVVNYVDNFLGFPAGTPVPTGYYDRDQGAWVPARNGVVIDLVGERDGLADIDITGDGVADSPQELLGIGITEAERRALASGWNTGDSLWRIEITHFTPWDHNWPYGPPDDAEEPEEPSLWDRFKRAVCGRSGSIIDCDTQVLRETADIAGTPYTLEYASDRAEPRRADRVLEAQVPRTLPDNVREVVFTLTIAGRTITKAGKFAPGSIVELEWDGRDSYGRMLTKPTRGKLELAYRYGLVYQEPANFARSFARLSGVPLRADRPGMSVDLTSEADVTLGGYDARSIGLAGWTLSDVHVLEPDSGDVFLGGGGAIEGAATSFGPPLEPFAGTGSAGDSGDGGAATKAALADPQSLAVGADGTVYIADPARDRVRAVTPDGTIRTFAGTGAAGFSGDGGAATSAQLSEPSAVAVARNGTVLIADSNNNRIRAVSPGGTIRTVAGGGLPVDGLGDGLAATASRLRSPRGVAAAPGGGFWIADTNAHRVRTVGADGIISTAIGDGVPSSDGDGGPAASARVNRPHGLATTDTGELYVAETGGNRVRVLRTSGVVERVAGGGTNDGTAADGEQAVDARLDSPTSVAVARDGDIYISERSAGRVRRVNSSGYLSTFVGAATTPTSGLAAGADLLSAAAVASGPNDSVYVADPADHHVYVVPERAGELDASDVVVRSPNTPEVYVFSPGGRHLRTLDATTGALMRRISYTPAGHLASIDEQHGNVTRVERDAGGRPVAIIGPYGARTELTQSAAGTLTQLTDPVGRKTQLSYDSRGALTEFKVGDVAHRYEYDADGRLVRDVNAVRDLRLSRERLTDGTKVTLDTVGGGRSETFSVRTEPDGSTTRVATRNGVKQSQAVQRPDGTTVFTGPTGGVITTQIGQDPRFPGKPATTGITVQWPGEAPVSSAQSIDLVAGLANGGPFDFSSITTAQRDGTASGTAIYVGADRTERVATAGGLTSTQTLDAEGRIVSSTTGTATATTTLSYDNRDRLSKASIDGRETLLEYGSTGDLSAISVPGRGRTEFERNAAGDITQLRRPGLPALSYSYDDVGDLVSLRADGRGEHRMKYDAEGRVVETTAPERRPGDVRPRTTSYSYDAAGRPTRVTRPGRDALEIAYRSDDSVARVTMGSRTVVYEVDELGELSAIDDGAVRVASARTRGSETTTTYSGAVSGKLVREFDAAGLIRSTGVDGQPGYSYTRDLDGAATALGPMTLQRRSGDGRVTGATVGSLELAFEYNQLGTSTRSTVRAGGNVLFDQQLTRAPGGSVAAITEDGVATSYERDVAGQLVAVKRGGSVVGRYTYDAAGNRVKAESGGVTTDATYDGQDQPISVGAAQFTHNDSGQLRSRKSGDAITTYDYDALGALRSVNLPGSKTVSYTLDGLGRRVQRVATGEPTRRWLYGTEARGPAAEQDGSGAVTSTFAYLHPDAAPTLMRRGDATYLLVTDHLGSVRRVVDVDSGNVVQALDYDAWGQVTRDTNPAFQPFGFAGGLYDAATGLTRFGVRDYDARLGRWTNEDPLGLGAGDSNLFRYVGNDPVSVTDPSGMIAPVVVGVGLCAASAGLDLACGGSATSAAVACGTSLIGGGGGFAAKRAATWGVQKQASRTTTKKVLTEKTMTRKQKLAVYSAEATGGTFAEGGSNYALTGEEMDPVETAVSIGIGTATPFIPGQSRTRGAPIKKFNPKTHLSRTPAKRTEFWMLDGGVEDLEREFLNFLLGTSTEVGIDSASDALDD